MICTLQAFLSQQTNNDSRHFSPAEMTLNYQEDILFIFLVLLYQTQSGLCEPNHDLKAKLQGKVSSIVHAGVLYLSDVKPACFFPFDCDRESQC